jgi:hypothetical protein
VGQILGSTRKAGDITGPGPGPGPGLMTGSGMMLQPFFSEPGAVGERGGGGGRGWLEA